LVSNAEKDINAPVTSAALSPAPDGNNGWYKTNVTISLASTDDCAGVAATEYSIDGGQSWLPYAGSFSFGNEGTTTILYRSADRAGNNETDKSIVVNIDKTAPTLALSATPARISPPNGQMVDVTIYAQGADSASGLESVSYVVTDEYGTQLSIPTRALLGNSTASWTETLAVEARREGNDRNGRLYTVTATVTDMAGFTTTKSTSIVVTHDQRDR
jgi:hypothetical protein